MGFWTNFKPRMNPSNPLYITTAGIHQQEPVMHHQGSPDWHLLLTVGGEGILKLNGDTYLLSPGTFFLHPPYTPVEYYAISPQWTTISITYNGVDAAALSASLVGVHKTTDPFLLKEALHDIYLLPRNRRQSVGKRMLLELLTSLPDRIETRISANKGTEGVVSDDNLILSAVKFYIEKNLSERITVEDLCRVAGYKKTKLSALFKEKTGKSPHQYLKDCRYFRACELLKRALHLSVDEVARLSGYRSASYLDQCFREKRKSHLSPLQFRNRYLEVDSK